MGYYKGLINAGFKKTKDGKTAYYPYGILGVGYILSNDDDEAKIKAFLKKYYKISFLVIITGFFLLGIYVFTVLLFLIPFYSIKIKKLLINSEKTSEKIRIKDTMKNMAISMGFSLCVTFLIVDLIVVLICFFFIFVPNMRLWGIIGTLFFGIGFLQTTFLVKYSIRHKKENPKQRTSLSKEGERERRENDT